MEKERANKIANAILTLSSELGVTVASFAADVCIVDKSRIPTITEALAFCDDDIEMKMSSHDDGVDSGSRCEKYGKR